MLKAISTITNALGSLNYKGTWNASTNNPTLADGTGAKGDYYVVSTAGTQTFGGVQLFFGTGDWIVYNGAVWQRVEGGSDGNFANVTLTSTDAGATASPLLELYRDSASPAASDTLGEIEFNGEDSAGNKQAYGLIHASILSPTSTAEQGQLHFETATAGALTEKMIIGTNNLVINEIGGVFNVRIEGDTDANLFYTDATNSRIGIGTITPAEKLDVVGNIKLSGNVVLANGQGIDFSATSHPAGMTSELLADYEEGTWTPIYLPETNSFTSITYNIQSGRYTKIGRVVYFDFALRTASLTIGTATDGLRISGLPFTVSAVSQGTAMIGQSESWGGDFPLGAFIRGGTQLVSMLYRTAANGGTLSIQVSDMSTAASSNEISGGGFYIV